MAQTVLITGASRGIGLALAHVYAENGDDVIATCRNPDAATQLQEVANQMPSIRIMALDVGNAQSINSLADTLKKQPIDILINNAGILSGADPKLCALDQDPSQALGSVQEAALQELFRINTIAPVMVTQALLGPLRQSSTKKIVMISSGWGSIAGMTDDVPLGYGASKAALNAVTKSIALSLQKERFVVVTLSPGWVETDMGGHGADLSPDESASRLYQVVKSITPAQNGQFLRHTGEILAW